MEEPMKKILFITMMSIFILLAGCGKDEEKVETGVTAEVYFEAVVLEVNENSILVEPKEESNEKKSSDKIVVGRKSIEDEEFLKIMEQIGVGDTVSIGYDGMIAESYPAQITALEITILNKADSDDFMILLIRLKKEKIAHGLQTGRIFMVNLEKESIAL